MASKTTTNHDEIRRWAEERDGKPSRVKGTGSSKDDPGILRIDFPGYSGEHSLEHISWDEFFEKFDESGLALLHDTGSRDGDKSRFNKLISRTSEKSGGSSGRTATRAKSGGAARSGSSTSSKSKQSSSQARVREDVREPQRSRKT